MKMSIPAELWCWPLGWCTDWIAAGDACAHSIHSLPFCPLSRGPRAAWDHLRPVDSGDAESSSGWVSKALLSIEGNDATRVRQFLPYRCVSNIAGLSLGTCPLVSIFSYLVFCAVESSAHEDIRVVFLPHLDMSWL